jgi:hypothetical protein
MNQSISEALSSSNEDYWTERRKEIHNWLKEQSPSLAELYEGAVYLISTQTVSGRVRFISHAVREIRNRLPGELSDRVDYGEEIKKLNQTWKDHNLFFDTVGSISTENSQTNIPSSSIPIPLKVFSKIQSLLSLNPEKGRDKAKRLFERHIPESQIDSRQLSVSVDIWWKTTGWFMERAHDNGNIDAEYDNQTLYSQFEIFESFLGTLSQNFYSNTNELDKILEEANT